MASGAIHKTIYMPTLRELRICLPSVLEQRRIVAELNEVRETVARGRSAATAQLAAVDALPSALLRAAFRGEL